MRQDAMDFAQRLGSSRRESVASDFLQPPNDIGT